MLAHSNEGVGKFYTNHDWEKLATALRLLRERLQPMFDVPWERPFIRRRRRRAPSANDAAREDAGHGETESR